MANYYKILGRITPNTATESVVYTVPTDTGAIVNTIAVCNKGAASTFRLAVVPSGVSPSVEHWIVYDTAIGANDTINPGLTLSLESGDVIFVYADSANFSFTVSGVEFPQVIPAGV